MKKNNNFILTSISILLFFTILFSGYQLTKIYFDYKKSDSVYEDARITFSKETEKNNITIDFKELQKINKDIVGWIYFENEDISYPLLYSEGDDKYLKRAYTGERMTAGSIFVSGANSPDFSDRHTIIYGHNMKNLSMFGKLKYYKEKKDYYKGHEYFQIITPSASYRYRIFSYREVSSDSDVYTVSFANQDEFEKFVDEVLTSNSTKCSEIDLTNESRIITLSTCAENDKRFIVSAIRVKSIQ